MLPSAARAQEWVDPGPGRWQAGEREIIVTLGGQRLWAYEGDTSVLATWVSTGTAETPEVATPVGQWRILVVHLRFPPCVASTQEPAAAIYRFPTAVRVVENR